MRSKHESLSFTATVHTPTMKIPILMLLYFNIIIILNIGIFSRKHIQLEAFLFWINIKLSPR